MKFGLIGVSLGLLLAAGAWSPATAQWKPTSPVEVVVHTGPGGGNDALGRAMLTAMEKEKLLPVRFQIANKVGGGSATAMNYLREKKGDPHTISIFSSVYVSNPLVQPEANVTMDELTPIARLVLEPALVVVRADFALQDHEGLHRGGEAEAQWAEAVRRFRSVARRGGAPGAGVAYGRAMAVHLVPDRRRAHIGPSRRACRHDDHRAERGRAR